MGPIEDATNPPAEYYTQPIVGYWHNQQVYCPLCKPYDAARFPHIWQPIRATATPSHALICCNCKRVVVPAHTHEQH